MPPNPTELVIYEAGLTDRGRDRRTSGKMDEAKMGANASAWPDRRIAGAGGTLCALRGLS